jgi:hypothetical protein
MGGAETAGPTGKAQEAENIGGRFESHKRSHEEALGGLPQNARICGVSPKHGKSRRSNARCFGNEPPRVLRRTESG